MAPERPKAVGPLEDKELRARNTLELFDLTDDPTESVNRAASPDADVAALVAHLNAELSQLIDTEIGDDNGPWLPDLVGVRWTKR